MFQMSCLITGNTGILMGLHTFLSLMGSLRRLRAGQKVRLDEIECTYE